MIATGIAIDTANPARAENGGGGSPIRKKKFRHPFTKSFQEMVNKHPAIGSLLLLIATAGSGRLLTLSLPDRTAALDTLTDCYCKILCGDFRPDMVTRHQIPIAAYELPAVDYEVSQPFA